MPKGLKGTRVTDGVVPNYTTNTTPQPTSKAAKVKDIRRPGQPGGK